MKNMHRPCGVLIAAIVLSVTFSATSLSCPTGVYGGWGRGHSKAAWHGRKIDERETIKDVTANKTQTGDARRIADGSHHNESREQLQPALKP